MFEVKSELIASSILTFTADSGQGQKGEQSNIFTTAFTHGRRSNKLEVSIHLILQLQILHQQQNNYLLNV